MAETTIGNYTIAPLSESLQFMKEFGFFEVVLPLILVFAVFYGILTKTAIFGSPDQTTKPLYAVISFVAAFFVIASTDIVRMINEIIPSASFLLVLSVLILMMLGIFGFNPSDRLFGATWGIPGKIGLIILIIIFLGVVDMSMDDVEIPVIHGIATSFTGGDSGSDLSSEDTANLINLGVMLAMVIGLPIAVVYMIVKSSGTTNTGTGGTGGNS